MYKKNYSYWKIHFVFTIDKDYIFITARNHVYPLIKSQGEKFSKIFTSRVHLEYGCIKLVLPFMDHL